MLINRCENWIIIVLLIATGLLYFIGTSNVPFHPDESTFIYTSRDFADYLTQPMTLAWEPGMEATPEVRYRLRDEPASRWLFGLAFALVGIDQPAIVSDWDWTADWDSNHIAGAHPERAVLLAARFTSTLFTLSAGFLLYRTALKHFSLSAALTTFIVFSTSALTLLHGRRAMREGLMLFAMAGLIAAVGNKRMPDWLTGAITGAALCARFSIAPVAVIAFPYIVWERRKNNSPAHALHRLAVLIISATAVFYALQPVLWKHPIAGAQAMWEERSRFNKGGLDLIQVVSPGVYLEDPGIRLSFLGYTLFYAPPQYSDFSNYDVQLSSSISRYEASVVDDFWRGPLWGSLILILFLFSITVIVYRRLRGFEPGGYFTWLILAALLAEVVFVIAFFPVTIQRYALPLWPLVALVCGAVFTRGSETIQTLSDEAAL